MNDAVFKLVAAASIFGLMIFVASSGGCAVDQTKATHALKPWSIAPQSRSAKRGQS